MVLDPFLKTKTIYFVAVKSKLGEGDLWLVLFGYNTQRPINILSSGGTHILDS